MHVPSPCRAAARLLIIAGVLGAVLALTSCAHGASGRATLSDLVRNASAHDGEQVRTSGTVRAFRDTPQSAPYFVLEDAAHNRVLLDPPGGTAHDVGRHVVVEGCFTYSDTTGQRLAVTRVVSPAPTRASATSLIRSCAGSARGQPTISAPS